MIIQMSDWNGKRRSKSEPDGVRGEILFFTGVRYVRHPDPVHTHSPNQTNGSGSRKKRKRA